jgi:hypothetical protein
LTTALILPSAAWGQDLLLPEWEYEAKEDTSFTKRAIGETAVVHQARDRRDGRVHLVVRQ